MDEDVIKVKVLSGYKLRVWFKDGESGEVDISSILKFRGSVKKLQDREYFKKVRVNSESGCLEWPNREDVDPLILYSKATGKPIILNVPQKTQVYG